MPKRKAASAAAPAPVADEEEPQQSDGAADHGGDSSSDDPSSASDDPSASSDDEDGAAFDSVDVDFEFFDPQEGDFHGLRALLQSYLDGAQYNCSELVEAATRAPAGTVIKCGEGEEAVGLAAVLPLQAHAGLECLAQLRTFLLRHCPGAGDRAELERAWAAPGTALLLSERLLNCPPQLATPLMSGLLAEVAAGGHHYAAIERYLVVARAYSDPAAEAKHPKQKQKPKPVGLIHATPEGEFLCNHAAWKFSFPVPGRAVGKHDLAPRRVVALVEAAAVPAAMRELKAVLPPPL
jgi:protein BCP1